MGLPTQLPAKSLKQLKVFPRYTVSLSLLLLVLGQTSNARGCVQSKLYVFKIVLMLTLNHRFCISFKAPGVCILYLFLNTLKKAKMQAHITFKYRVTF